MECKFLSVGKHFPQASKEIVRCQDKFQRMFQQNDLVVWGQYKSMV